MVVLPTPGRPLRTISMCSRQRSAWPRLHEVEGHVPTNTLKIPVVLGHEHAALLAARQSQQDIVGERLRHATDLEPLFSSHFREHIARTMPGTCGRRKHPSRSLEEVEGV